MSFVPNENQQITMDDQYFSFTTREKRFLKKSWATYFADHIFPKINEERFAVLYSDNKASRPGTPVNIVVGALLLKEMRGQSDDDILESILFPFSLLGIINLTSCSVSTGISPFENTSLTTS